MLYLYFRPSASSAYHLLVLTLQVQLYHPVHFLKHSAKLYYEKSMKSNFSLLLASRPNFWNRFLKMKKKYLQRIGCDFTRLCNLKKILLKLYLINFVYFSQIYKMIYKFSGLMDQSIDHRKLLCFKTKFDWLFDLRLQ